MKKNLYRLRRNAIVTGIVSFLIAASFIAGVNGNNYSGSYNLSTVSKAKEIIISDNGNGIRPLSRGENWWNTDWTYRINITIDSSKIGDSLSGFPVLINLSNSNFDFDHAQTNGGDIRFIDYYDNTTEFAYEIEKWDSVSEKAVIWVNISSIPDTTDTIFIMYYGNNFAADNQDLSKIVNTDAGMQRGSKSQISVLMLPYDLLL